MTPKRDPSKLERQAAAMKRIGQILGDFDPADQKRILEHILFILTPALPEDGQGK